MKSYLAIFFIIVLSGCGTIPEVDPIAVNNFKYQELDKGDDVGLYLIRPNLFAGGGRGYWVAVDDKVIGNLENNTHAFLSLNSNENKTINTVMSMASQNFIAITSPDKEEKYFFVKVGMDSFSPVFLTPDLGKTMVSQTERQKLDYKQRPNDGYDNLAMNPSLVAEYMTTSLVPALRPDDKNGVIVFIRPSSTEKSMRLNTSIWANGKHLGALDAKQFFKVKLPVGQNKIYRKDGEFHSLDIEVKANETYYIELEESFSFTGYNHELKPLNANDSDLQSWLLNLTEVTPTPENKWSNNQKVYVERGQEYFNSNKKFFLKETQKFPSNYAKD